MKARLKSSTVIHGADCDWILNGIIYEAEFSERMFAPRPVILVHPGKPEVFCELPFNSVEILSDQTRGMRRFFRLFGAKASCDAVTLVLREPEVRAVLESAGRTELDLRELEDRFVRSGVEPEHVPAALRNVALLRWFFALPDTNKISLDDSLRLINWARYRNPMGPQ